MWQLIKELPLDIVGNIFTVLSVKDIVQLERALVTPQQRSLLFDLVRAGPSLRVYIALSDEEFYNWLRRYKLVRANGSFDEVTKSRGEIAHEHVESLVLTVNNETSCYPDSSALYSKVTTLRMNCANIHFEPGKYLHKLHEFSTHAANCLDDWVLEVIRANPTLRTLKLEIPDGESPPARWFSKLGRLCGNIHKLHLSGLRSVVDDDVLWEVAEHCTALRTLDIYYFAERDSMLAEGPMIAITQQCKRLSNLSVCVVTMMAPAVTAICSAALNLTSLQLSTGRIEPSDMLLLLPQCRKQRLTSLCCGWELQLVSEVQACAALFPGLKVLKVTLSERHAHAFAAAVPLLCDMRELHITLFDTHADAAVYITAVADICTQLREFALTALTSASLVDEKVAPGLVARNRYLRRLMWTNVSVVDHNAVLRALAQHCPLLERVTCADVSDDAVHVLAAGCSHLRRIKIESSRITDAALVSLSTHCRELCDIDIGSCHKVTEAGLAALIASCPRLTSLTVSRNSLDAAAAARIRSKRARGGDVHVWVR
jgi:hypothetical protein